MPDTPEGGNTSTVARNNGSLGCNCLTKLRQAFLSGVRFWPLLRGFLRIVLQRERDLRIRRRMRHLFNCVAIPLECAVNLR